MVGLDPATCEVEVNRIASDETARYILIKNQPNSNMSNDEIVVDSGVVEERMDAGNDRVDTNGDRVDTGGDTVDISDDKVVTSGDIRHDRGDPKGDTAGDTVHNSSDTPGGNDDREISIHSDSEDTKNKMENDMMSRDMNIRNVTIDDVVYITDDKPGDSTDHSNSKINTITDNIEDTISYEVDTDGDKVDINSDVVGVNSDTVGLTSDKVDVTDYNKKATGDTVDTKATTKDDKMDTYNKKVDAQCNKVTMVDEKFDAVVDKVDTTENKGGINSTTTKQVTSEAREITIVGATKTESQHTPAPERTSKQPEKGRDDNLLQSGAPVSNEVEIMSSDSDSGKFCSHTISSTTI